MREALSETDWASLLRDVARRLLGEPPRTYRNGNTWRYGTKGSLAVHVGGDWAGWWHDFETGENGGTLDLVQRELQCDKAAALRWLEDEGLIERRAAHDGGTRAQTPAPRRPVPRATPTRQPQQPSETAPLAAAILRAAVPADDTPARKYLAQRWTWPLVGIGPDLPTTVRYIDAGDMPEGRRDDGTPYRLLPAAAAGCVVFKLTDPAGERPPAVDLEAVTAAGRRLDWRWRYTYGNKKGLVFEARNVPGGHLWLVEGECDALALALCGHGGCVRSGAGAAGICLETVTDPERRPLVIVADGDAPGAYAASRLRAELSEVSDRGCEVHYLRDGDVADALAYWADERAGIRDAGDPNADATWTAIAVWEDILTAIKRGVRLIDPVKESK